MSFIQWLGDWLRKVSTSVKSITAGTNSLTYTRHNNDSVTIPLTLESDLYVKKTGDTVTGNINSLYGVDGIETVNQFSGEMAVNDLWALRTGITGNPDPAGATGSTITDNGFLEIATADNGTEPIYVSQYEGDHMLPDSQGVRFYRQVHRATLLDEQGNTVFPGTVTAASFNGNATSSTHATNASYATSAGTASKLGSVDVGSATQPIYLNDGVATACTYQLHKTVPADAKFTDTVYTHPTTSGNKHIPSGGSSGQILRWYADGTAVWGNDNNTTYGDATTSASGLMSATDKTKLDSIATGAEVNQNAFSNIKVGNTTVAANTKTDTLELEAGTGITLTPDAANDKVTIAVTSGTYADASHTHPYIPTAGGDITGAITQTSTSTVTLKFTDTTGRVTIGGGTSYNTGAYIWLYGKDHASEPGYFDIDANNGTTYSRLRGTPDGTLTWKGKNIAVVDSVDATTSGYIRLSNGIQMVWGSANIVAGNESTGVSVTYEKPFSNTPRVFTNTLFGSSYGYGYCVQAVNRTATGCTLIIGSSKNGTTQAYGNGNVVYFAIGPWA